MPTSLAQISAMSDSTTRLLTGQASASGSQDANNSTCYWATDSIKDSDSPAFPFMLYFLIAFGVVRAFRTVTNMKQLQRYK